MQWNRLNKQFVQCSSCGKKLNEKWSPPAFCPFCMEANKQLTVGDTVLGYNHQRFVVGPDRKLTRV